jgi:hypothetical protein
MYDGGSENRKGYCSCLRKLNLGTNEEDVSSASFYRFPPSKIAVLAQGQLRVKARREMIERNQFRSQNFGTFRFSRFGGCAYPFVIAPSRASVG